MHTLKLLCHSLVTLSLITAGAATASAAKRVVVDKSTQTLRAYENGQLVFRTRVSTGKPGKETPNGTFSAKGKKRMHYSSRYHNAPMPYSVQYSGHYFLHGFSSVPHYPASSGCIRLPMNAAPAFYNWITPGTPVTVTGHWSGPKRQRIQKSRRTAKRQRVIRQHRYPSQVAESHAASGYYHTPTRSR